MDVYEAADDPLMGNFLYTYNLLGGGNKDFFKGRNMRVSTSKSPSAPRLPLRKYIDETVDRYIRNAAWNRTRFSYNIDETKVGFVMWSLPGDQHAIAETYLPFFNFHVAALNQIVGAKKKRVRVCLVLCPLPKMFPSGNDGTFTSKHVNSGFTLRFSKQPGFEDPRDCIVVYRQEEAQKVLLHELIHLYWLEFTLYPPSYDAYLMKKYFVQVKHPAKNPWNPLALYEAYVETLATYGMILTRALFSCPNPSSPGSLKPLLNAMLRKEVAFARRQARRINQHTDAHGQHLEDTHVFSYYVVKSALLQNMPLFRQYLRTHGIVVTDPIPFLNLICGLAFESETGAGIRGAKQTSSMRMTVAN